MWRDRIVPLNNRILGKQGRGGLWGTPMMDLWGNLWSPQVALIFLSTPDFFPLSVSGSTSKLATKLPSTLIHAWMRKLWCGTAFWVASGAQRSGSSPTTLSNVGDILMWVWYDLTSNLAQRFSSWDWVDDLKKEEEAGRNACCCPLLEGSRSSSSYTGGGGWEESARRLKI